MNALKHMEAIFLAAVVVIGLSAIASDAVAAAPAAKGAVSAFNAASAASNPSNASSNMVSVAGEAKIAVVRITAKRPAAIKIASR
ncbi:hypothetical protein [Massilia glaciei]|uniref:Uncharacterized protein n=1 Tax=Massilia glaciei TaxID=1524097 RepID=A0A2U2HMT3_9BURK|nr:hypothetical protein [Massilia glaciei]PWF48779.1 hypothetical protein C7C56_009900 [Massilia glaciei]